MNVIQVSFFSTEECQNPAINGTTVVAVEDLPIQLSNFHPVGTPRLEIPSDLQIEHNFRSTSNGYLG